VKQKGGDRKGRVGDEEGMGGKIAPQ